MLTWRIADGEDALMMNHDKYPIIARIEPFQGVWCPAPPYLVADSTSSNVLPFRRKNTPAAYSPNKSSTDKRR